MYVVASKWEFDPAHDQQVREGAKKMMATINGWPEVEFAYNVKTGDNTVLAIIGYTDEASYQRLIQDPNGPFEKAAKEHDIERHGTWLWSERGEVVEP